MKDYQGQINLTDMNKENSPQKRPELSQAIVHMVSDGGEDFLQYLKIAGLSSEPNLLVLSQSQHYYYDESDLRDLRTLVNIKKLNLIRHLDQFLHNLYRILPADAHFIGCFSEINSPKQAGSHSNNPSGIIDSLRTFIGSVTGNSMTRNEVSEILKTHGFKVTDMTEINGITYFTSKNLRRSAERNPSSPEQRHP